MVSSQNWTNYERAGVLAVDAVDHVVRPCRRRARGGCRGGAVRGAAGSRRRRRRWRRGPRPAGRSPGSCSPAATGSRRSASGSRAASAGSRSCGRGSGRVRSAMAAKSLMRSKYQGLKRRRSYLLRPSHALPCAAARPGQFHERRPHVARALLGRAVVVVIDAPAVVPEAVVLVEGGARLHPGGHLLEVVGGAGAGDARARTASAPVRTSQPASAASAPGTTSSRRGPSTPAGRR